MKLIKACSLSNLVSLLFIHYINFISKSVALLIKLYKRQSDVSCGYTLFDKTELHGSIQR